MGLQYSPAEAVRGRPLASDVALRGNDRPIGEPPTARSPADQAVGATRRLTLMPNSGLFRVRIIVRCPYIATAAAIVGSVVPFGSMAALNADSACPDIY